MAQPEHGKSNNEIPLGRVFHFRDLPGWVSKNLDVPAGRLGVVIYPNGRSRTFQPGKHKILSALQRLAGRGIGMRAGYVPTGTLTTTIALRYLLSGDGELLEGNLICAVEIADPIRFFNEVVVPNGELRPQQLALNPEPIKDAIGSFSRDFVAADLVHGTVTGRVLGSAQPAIEALLGSQGMRLAEVTLFTLSRASDRALIREKSLEIEERLKNADLQAAMAQIETQEQLLEFLEQLSPGLKRLVRFQMGPGAGSILSAARAGIVAEALQKWFGAQGEQEAKGRWWRIQSLVASKPTKQPTPDWPVVRHPPRNWWAPRAIWISVALALGWALTALINTNLRDAALEARVGLYVTIWTFEIGVILESVKYLYQKREAISEIAWPLSGHQQLDKLVGNDRQKADELVRNECIRELAHIKDVVSDIRSREHGRNNIDLALKLRNTVEARIQDCIAQIADASRNQPAYLQDIRITRDAWRNTLDLDEELLLYSQGLSEKAHLIQKQSHANVPIERMMDDLDAGVLELCNRFHSRGRALQRYDD